MGLLRRVAAKVVDRVRGGEPAQAPSPPPPAATPTVDEAATLATIECGAQELKERLDAGEHVVIVDVRAATTGGGLPGARHLPLAELEQRWRELADADEIVCTCQDGSASLRAARLLRRNGLINATRLEGGLVAWTAAGGALVPTAG